MRVLRSQGQLHCLVLLVLLPLLALPAAAKIVRTSRTQQVITPEGASVVPAVRCLITEVTLVCCGSWRLAHDRAASQEC
jgi:hypothetical protein